MFVKKNGKWEDEGGEVTADKLQEVIENNQEQLGSVIQQACTASSGEGIGIAGINGISGFLPDYSRKIELDIVRDDNIAALFNWPVAQSTAFISSQPVSEDGYINIIPYNKNNGIGISYGILNNDKTKFEIRFGNEVLYTIGEEVWGTFFFPIRKGTYPAFVAFTKSYSDLGGHFRFYPVLKPDFTQEHIVGYLGDKPIYERHFSGTTKLNSGNWNNIIPTDCIIDKVIFLQGEITTSSAKLVVPFMVSGSTAMSLAVSIDGTYIMEQHLNSSHNSKPISVYMRYTKTTD